MQASVCRWSADEGIHRSYLWLYYTDKGVYATSSAADDTVLKYVTASE